MNYYEAIFIVHPALEDSALAQLVRETKEIFIKRGSDIVYDEEMGKKRLAYPIEKQRFGTFYLLHFTSDGQQNVQINRDLEHKDNILAHMIVRIEEDEVRQVTPESEAEPEKAVAGKEQADTGKEEVKDTVEKTDKETTTGTDPAPEVTEPLESEATAEKEVAPTDEDLPETEPAE